MKRTALMLMLLPFAAFASTLSDGLMAEYKFDGDLSDSSGGEHGLSVYGKTDYCEDRRGNADSAFMLDGNSALYEASTRDERVAWSSNFTFSCWFKASEETELCNVVASGICGTTAGTKYLCGDSDLPVAIGTNGINVFEHGNYFLPAVFKYEGSIGETWHHFSITCSGNQEVAVYLDGEPIGAFNKLRPNEGMGADLGLGSPYASAVLKYRGIGAFNHGGHFKGGIDDVRFYNRPLLAEEVKALYVGYEWTYVINDGEVTLGGGTSQTTAIPKDTAGLITIPSTLGGYPVTCVGQYAFMSCTNLTGVVMPTSVRSIDKYSFMFCSKLVSITIPELVTNISAYAFGRSDTLTRFEVAENNQTYASVDGLLYNKAKTTLICVPSGLREVTIPENTASIADSAFFYCSKLLSVTFLGSAPASDGSALIGTRDDLVVHVDATKAGWVSWGGRSLTFDVGKSDGTSCLNINLTVTNVIVHYIQTSELSPMAAPISADVGIVNVMTEIKGGNISIPESWTENYPTFATKFGSNFSDALISETGKFDVGGKPMYVWQDFVAGTDPTDKDSVFKASVTIVEGVPVISYTPKLSVEEAAKRIYTTYGKVKLQDANWTVVPAGHEADYNFFKVTVEMK